jgi:hypothetical protein
MSSKKKVLTVYYKNGVKIYSDIDGDETPSPPPFVLEPDLKLNELFNKEKIINKEIINNKYNRYIYKKKMKCK